MLLKMQRFKDNILLVTCCFTMTSFAMQSGKYVMMTDSPKNTHVCSTDKPSQVLPICSGGEVQCGMQCLVSSCPYYQFKPSTPIQCELYNQFPVNFKIIDDCIGFRPSLPFSKWAVSCEAFSLSYLRRVCIRFRILQVQLFQNIQRMAERHGKAGLHPRW